MSAQSELTFDGVPASEPDRPQWTETSVKGTVSSVVFASEDGASVNERFDNPMTKGLKFHSSSLIIRKMGKKQSQKPLQTASKGR